MSVLKRPSHFSQNVASALSDRLRAKNPTKVYLAIVLTRKVST